MKEEEKSGRCNIAVDDKFVVFWEKRREIPIKVNLFHNKVEGSCCDCFNGNISVTNIMVKSVIGSDQKQPDQLRSIDTCKDQEQPCCIVSKELEIKDLSVLVGVVKIDALIKVDGRAKKG